MFEPQAAQVIEALRAQLRTDLDGVEAMARMAQDEATGDQSKSEGKYDTRSLEASYLARGQAERVVSLRRVLAWALAWSPLPTPPVRAALGTVVCVETHTGPRHLFLVPAEGGRTVAVAGVQIQVVTTASPVGRALLGLELGDQVEGRAAFAGEVVGVG